MTKDGVKEGRKRFRKINKRERERRTIGSNEKS